MRLPSFNEVGSRAQGRWAEVLSGLGIDSDYLRKHHGECPGCGGKDRFRFDDINGRGTWYCSGGGNDQAGDGFQLLQHVHGWDTKEALARVAGFLGVGPATSLSAAEADELARKAQSRVLQDQKQHSEELAATAKRAQAIWDSASEAPNDHPYLVSKSVRAFGIRYRIDGNTPELLLPLRDISGAIRNLERIRPTGITPNKMVLGKGTSGLFHWIGEPSSSPEALILAEGYATAASIHEATGRSVIVCRSANNIEAVASQLIPKFANARLCVAADLDVAGEKAAQTVAEAFQAIIVRPNFTESEIENERASGRTCKDFNDMHRLQGLAAVGNRFTQALQGMTNSAAEISSPAPPTSRASKSENTSKASSDLFSLRDSGLYYMGDETPYFVCGWIDGYALTRDRESKGWMLCLRFRDQDDKMQEADIPLGDLAGDGVEPVKALANLGLRVAGAKAAKHLMNYLRSAEPKLRVRTVFSLGWHEFGTHGNSGEDRSRAFLWPDGHISGNGSEALRLHHSVKNLNSASSAGTLAEWQREVAKLCVENSRLTFGVCCAFAAPMMHLLERPTVGFNIFGNTSTGKSTTAYVAASVFGRPKGSPQGDYLQNWRATDNGMEATARAFSSFLLVIDELKQMNASIAQDAIYMLGNERVKARATVSGDARAFSTWRLMYLSTGEITVKQHMAEVNKRPDPGVGVRLIELPADPSKGHGVFDTLHGFPHGKDLSEHLKEKCGQVYGIAGLAFIERLALEWDSVASYVRKSISHFLSSNVQPDASPEVGRAADAFAVVAQAGELATKWGITSWPEGAATVAAENCFKAWLEQRGGKENAGDMEALRQIATFVSRFHEGRFPRLERVRSTELGNTMDSHAPRTLDVAGYAQFDVGRGEDVYYFLPSGFAEACKGFSPRNVATLLKERGYLVTSEAKGLQCGKRGLPNFPRDKPTRTYAVRASVMELGE